MNIMEVSDKVKKYEDFLDNVLKKDLQKELENRDAIYGKIATHSQLKQTVECLLEANLEEGLRTRVDLGSNFYAHAYVPDPSKIYVNIGLNLHLEMTLPEAVKFCEAKLKILNEEVVASTKRSAKIKGHIKFVMLALGELQGIKVVDTNEVTNKGL